MDQLAFFYLAIYVVPVYKTHLYSCREHTSPHLTGKKQFSGIQMILIRIDWLFKEIVLSLYSYNDDSMNFQPIPCHESLRPFIRNYWMLTAYCTATDSTQQMFSNGAASLQFYLSQPVSLDWSEQQYHTALFHQNMEKVGIISDEGDFNIFGVEFVPYCSRVFFRTEMNGIYASPEDLHDDELIALSKAIHAAGNTEERVKMLDEFFLKRLAEFPEGDINIERLNDVFEDIVPTDKSTVHSPKFKDDFSPADLASTACLSQKQFTRVFHKYVGMNPKSYLRLLRFHKALQMLQAHLSEPSGDNRQTIAWQCGYYDLAHMISDFRDICGYSPTELIQSGTKLTEAFGQQFSGLMKKKIKIENLI